MEQGSRHRSSRSDARAVACRTDRFADCPALHPVELAGRPGPIRRKGPADSLKQTVLAQREWLPLLQIGKEKIFDRSFDDQGEVRDPAPPAFGGAVEGLTRRMEGMLGRSAAAGSPTEPAAQRHVTAVWIDYEMHVPGRAPRRARREIFDLLGPARRRQQDRTEPNLTEDAQRLARGLALLGTTNILVMASRLSPEFAEVSIANQLLAHQDALLKQIRADSSSSSPDDRGARDMSSAAALYALALARTEWSRVGNDVYLDAANVLSSHVQFGETDWGELAISQGLDIVFNGVTSRLPAPQDSFLLQLTQGVVDTNAEAILAARLMPDAPAPSIFAAGAGEDVEWSAVRTVNDPALRDAELSNDVRARIELDIAAGYIAVIPARNLVTGGRSRAGWWRIDPHTGETLGIGDRGWGQSQTEINMKVSALTIGVVGATAYEFVLHYSAGSSIRETSRCAAKFVCILSALLLAIRFFRTAATIAAACRFM